jgi:hypothetical protein
MTVLRRTRWVIWTALAAAVLCQPGPALAQSGSEPGLDISLADGRITMNVRDASLSRVLREIAAKAGFALDIAGERDPKVSASFENIPVERALRRIVGRSSYIIELAPRTGADGPRRIGKLSVFMRGALAPVETSAAPRAKRAKPGATKTRRGKRRRPRSPGSLINSVIPNLANADAPMKVASSLNSSSPGPCAPRAQGPSMTIRDGICEAG